MRLFVHACVSVCSAATHHMTLNAAEGVLYVILLLLSDIFCPFFLCACSHFCFSFYQIFSFLSINCRSLLFLVLLLLCLISNTHGEIIIIDFLFFFSPSCCYLILAFFFFAICQMYFHSCHWLKNYLNPMLRSHDKTMCIHVLVKQLPVFWKEPGCRGLLPLSHKNTK